MFWFDQETFKHDFLLKRQKVYTQITHALILPFSQTFHIFFIFQRLFQFHNFNLKLCSKQYNKIDLLPQIVVPQLSGARQNKYFTKTRQAGHANEQSINSLSSPWVMSILPGQPTIALAWAVLGQCSQRGRLVPQPQFVYYMVWWHASAISSPWVMSILPGQSTIGTI